MIFTTFTVIFLPLTFFTGLFGMNTREWGGENNLPLKTIGAISLPSSLALIAISLIAAWSTNARRLIKGMIRATLRLWTKFGDPAVRTAVRLIPQKGRGTQGQIQDKESRGRKTGLGEEVSDFWERHRLERERGYTVPDKNRRVGKEGKTK
jgi:hypothetical protein